MTHHILVTGCNGTVGRHITQALLDAGHRVTGVSLEVDSSQPHRGLNYVQLDVTNESAVNQLVAEHQFDAVVHLAALVHVRHEHYGFAEYNRVNHRASEHLFRQAATHGTRRFLFTSTVEVYGPTPTNLVIDERTHCRPESNYAQTKILAEEALIQVAQTTSSSYAILRLAPVYAAGFTLNIDKRLYLRKPVGYYLSNGNHQLALCSVFNIVHFVLNWLAQLAPSSGIFNIADVESYSINDLLQRERDAGRCRIAVRLPYAACLVGLAALQTILAIAGREPNVLSVVNLHKLARSAHWDTRRATEAVGELPWTIYNTPGYT